MRRNQIVRNLILSKDNLTSLSLDPAKTIFWVGAGIGADIPCNLPLGNALTDAFLYTMLGDKAEEFILYWNNHIPSICDCVKNGEWSAPSAQTQYTIEDVRLGKTWDRPRLEFIIGEINKLDQEFQGITCENPKNKNRYNRKCSIESLAHFAEAEPNLLHHRLADFAKAGATIVTANFDACIEKALGVDVKNVLPTVHDGVKGIETGSGFIYHFHGIATDDDIQNSLGATVNNISRKLPDEFTAKLIKDFQDGYSIVFVGYSGLDFFDVQPFFDSLKPETYPGKAIYLHYCANNLACENALKAAKRYEYLLSPFRERLIAYGLATDFFDIIGKNSGISSSIDVSAISKTPGRAFNDTQRQLRSVADCKDKSNAEIFYFLNMFRLTSQLNINPVNFYTDWSQRIKNIYEEWKNDKNMLSQMFNPKWVINDCIIDDIRYNNWESKDPVYLSVVSDIRPQINTWNADHQTVLSGHMSWKRRGASREQIDEFVDKTCKILQRGAFTTLTQKEQDIERDTVHYLCGWQMKKVYAAWAIPIVRYAMYPKLKYLKEKIEQLTAYPFNYYMYRTYYLSLCRQLGAIKAMLGDKPEANGFYGNVQQEWNICMETPNLYDARMVIKARMLQFWIMVCKLKIKNIKKYKELRAIYRELDRMREDR